MVNVTEKIKNTKEKINSLDFDAHWYRRVFHAFGASFLFYYMLPDIDLINSLKFWIPPVIVVIAILLEMLRLKGKISSDHFFGLRMYEQKRIGSYVFFAIAILILLRFFPQHISIPCILCACIGDPIIGEIRQRLSMKHVYVFGFLICMFFFMITWYKVDVRIVIIASIVGGFGAVFGETKKFWWLDDDFMIQMVPAILLFILWISLPYLGFNFTDPTIIYPGKMPW